MSRFLPLGVLPSPAGIEFVLDRDGIRGKGDGPKGPRGGGKGGNEEKTIDDLRSSQTLMSMKDAKKVVDWEDSLSEGEAKALLRWENEYKRVRAAMVTGEGLDAKIQARIDNMQSALDKAPQLSPTNQWRGINNVSERDVATYTKVGAKIEMKGFNSWTTNPEIAGKFAGKKGGGSSIVFQIKSKSGMRALDNSDGEIIRGEGRYKVVSVADLSLGAKTAKLVSLEEL